MMRRRSTVIVLATTAAALATTSGAAARQRCDVRTPAGAVVDCFSGLHSDALWRLWLADAMLNRVAEPCGNRNAIAYEGSFSFYGGGLFIACSQTEPNMLSGFFQVRRTFRFVDGNTRATLTRGSFSATAAWDNVLELVFSDAVHRHYAQPEVVLGRFRN